MKKLNRNLMVSAALAACVVNVAVAQESAQPKERLEIIDAFESATGLTLNGFIQAGYSRNNNVGNGGGLNHPIVGAGDTGFQFNALALSIEKPITTNILPRITPLPGPMPWEASFGFHAEYLYGRNGLPAGMNGFSGDTGPTTAPEVAGGDNRNNYRAYPQVYAQAFFPIWQGVAVTAGRFGSGVGRDIPSAWVPGPQVFYSHTYALVSQPDQVKGVLGSVNLMRNEYGFLAGEIGKVLGRQNWTDNNKDLSTLGALRWRSTDMETWIDYSFMSGNEANDMTYMTAPQMPTQRILSLDGSKQNRTHHSLSVGMTPADKWRVNAEFVEGKQNGNGVTTLLITPPGPPAPFTTKSYKGYNVQATYAASDVLRYAVRYEVFKDPAGIALFPVTAASSTFNALTAGFRYKLANNVHIRPEIRRDWQTNNNGVNAFGGGKASSQTTISTDLLVYF